MSKTLTVPATQSRSANFSQRDYRVTRITPADLDEVVNYLLDEFRPNEPHDAALGTTREEATNYYRSRPGIHPTAARPVHCSRVHTRSATISGELRAAPRRRWKNHCRAADFDPSTHCFRRVLRECCMRRSLAEDPRTAAHRLRT